MPNKPKHTHKTVKVSRGEVDVDELLVPLIPLLWSHGIGTEQCCQEEQPGLASITFPDLRDVCAFLSMAGMEYPVMAEIWDEGDDDERDFVGRLLVRFPVTDIPKLVKAFGRKPQK
ncbi:hypothetical protein AYO44_03870 [Planctomycetaceae bacterium SCGC AG-212-F19]|nr:hypothetical protein AYO44_03870 [Planctomycetaceae bacterium SCGC AG-212-F19]